MRKLYLKQMMSLNPSESKRIYVVTQVVNSIKPKINDELDPVAVKEYCDLGDWQVIIK